MIGHRGVDRRDGGPVQHGRDQVGHGQDDGHQRQHQEDQAGRQQFQQEHGHHGRQQVQAQPVPAHRLPEPERPAPGLLDVVTEADRILSDRYRAEGESHSAQAFAVHLKGHVEVLDHQAAWVDRDTREHRRAVHAGEAGDDMGGVGPPPGLAVLQQPLSQRVDPAPVGGDQPPHERQAGSAPVAMGAPGHRDDVRIVEQGQRRLEVARIEPGVGVEQEHGAEPVDQAERANSLFQGAGLADVRGRLDDVDAVAERELDRVIGGRVRYDVHVPRRHERGDSQQRVVNDDLFVMRSHQDSYVGDGEDPAPAGGEGGAGHAAVRPGLGDLFGPQRPVRRRAGVPRQGPEPVQPAVGDPDQADRRPGGEVDTEDEREQQPRRAHRVSSREPGAAGPAARTVIRPGQQSARVTRTGWAVWAGRRAGAPRRPG